jgi:predicted RNA-binding protein YlqC (UPF0109 family)
MAHISPVFYSADVDVSDSVGQLLLAIVRNLVAQPERVTTMCLSEGGTRLIVVSVAPDDLQSVLGTQGRTARSLRSVVDAIATSSNQRVELEIHAEEQAGSSC